MSEAFDPTLFDDALTPEARQAFRAALEADPALAEAYARWQRVRAAVRHSLDAHVPDRHALVYFALDATGRPDLLTAAEREALEAARPALERAFEAHPALRDVVRRIQAEADDFEAVWETHAAATTSPARADRPARRMRRSPARRWGWRIAATASLVLFAVVVTMLVQRERGMVTLRTDEGEVRLVEMADGSTARLMGGSELTYADPAKGGASTRRARLTGRAFFDIVPDRRAFTIETPTALTTVLGTTFGVRADEAETEVVLVTGRVSLASRAARERFVVLEPGQRSRVAAGALPSTPAPVDLAEALDWTGLFIFRAASLADAVSRLSAHYRVPVSLAPELAADSISGTFGQDQPLEAILRTLAATLAAEVRPTGDGGFVLAPSR
ncbi:FecR domain-containing protein [Rhodocaloribacter sp.]